MINIEGDIPDDNDLLYIVPSASELSSFESIVDNILAEDFAAANAIAADYDYEVIEYTDTNNNLTYYILLEDNPISRGWGTYVFNLNNTQDILIETPHPVFEPYICEIGIEVFVNLEEKAKAYLMAGTYRYALYQDGFYISDVTRSFDNVFEIVHEKNVSTTAKSIQIHGFSILNHPGYPDIILSNGNPPPAPGNEEDEFNSIEDTLENDYSTTVGICNGVLYNDLSAGINRQGQYVRNNGMGNFYHFEVEAYGVGIWSGPRQNVIDGLTDHYTNY
ncbi:MAG: hypothetical protein HQ596_06005 [Candidatus Saganbacteria bacterium]|nr:hypothetical protein [Candidatus Saganbacteria bacterium]